MLVSVRKSSQWIKENISLVETEWGLESLVPFEYPWIAETLLRRLGLAWSWLCRLWKLATSFMRENMLICMQLQISYKKRQIKRLESESLVSWSLFCIELLSKLVTLEANLRKPNIAAVSIDFFFFHSNFNNFESLSLSLNQITKWKFIWTKIETFEIILKYPKTRF